MRFEIKSAQLSLVAVLLKSDDWAAVANDLLTQFGPQGEAPDFFEHDPVVLDFSPITSVPTSADLDGLCIALRACHLIPIAFRGVPQEWTEKLLQMGWISAPFEIQRAKDKTERVEAPEVVAAPVTTVTREVIREVPGPATLVIDKPLRSGQKVYARGGDLVVLAMVNQGAEVVADGNIHVYAPLRGKAMAGARGNTQARIFSLCLEPELVSIAGVYRTSENPLPPHIAAQPAQIRLSADGQDKLIFESLNS